MKAFIEEFKSFAMKGNMLDMAVGAFIATAFSGLVTSLSDNFIQPILNIVSGANIYSLQEWMGFGSAFVSNVIDFLIKAFALFCILKAINKAMAIGHKEEAPAAPTTKICPFCKSEIPIDACRCSHCTSELPAEEKKD
ncbi:MAG: large conductance mechanosensitive channel protein MscL [Eubacteriales bacterium]|nr:large conductance mechanosensitive channel protein MscL [Eubacteriales bacterium]